MKKKILTALLCTIISGAASAAFLFSSSCGIQTYTIVPQSVIDGKESLREYVVDLDNALCGGN